MYPVYGALPVQYVPVWVTRGAPVAHRYTYASPRCRTSQDSTTVIPLSLSLWTDLADQLFDGVGLAGFKSKANTFMGGPKLLAPILSFTVFAVSSLFRLVS